MPSALIRFAPVALLVATAGTLAACGSPGTADVERSVRNAWAVEMSAPRDVTCVARSERAFSCGVSFTVPALPEMGVLHRKLAVRLDKRGCWSAPVEAHRLRGCT